MVIHGVWIVGSLFHMGFNSGLNEMKLARNYLWAIRSVNVVICSGKLFCGFLFLVHNVGVLDNGGLMRWLDYDAINNYWTRLNVPVQREKVYKRGLTVIYWYWYVGWNTGTKKDNSKRKNAKQNKKDNSSLLFHPRTLISIFVAFDSFVQKFHVRNASNSKFMICKTIVVISKN